MRFFSRIARAGVFSAAAGVGAQHSQCFESFYAHVPGLKVVMPATPAEGKGLLKSAIRDPNPIVFIESEIQYSMKGEVPDVEDLVRQAAAAAGVRGLEM